MSEEVQNKEWLSVAQQALSSFELREATTNAKVPTFNQERTPHGSRVTRVTYQSGAKYMLKKPVSAHCNDAVDRACRFSTMVSELLENKFPNCPKGFVSTLAFQPRKQQSSASYEFLFDTNQTQDGKPVRFVCSKYMEDTIDLKQAQRDNLLSVNGVRFHLARALGVLHSFQAQAKEILSSKCPNRHHWHGSISSRLAKLQEVERMPELSESDWRSNETPDQVLASFGDLQELQDIVDKLPKYPITNDLQSKNFIIDPTTSRVTIVNTEILWSSTRLWDLLYLFLVDDACSGVFSITETSETTSCGDVTSTCLQDFAKAVGIYSTHVVPGNPVSQFSEDEVNLFTDLLRVKLAQVSLNPNVDSTDIQRNCRLLLLLTHYPQWSDAIQSILRNAHSAYRHDIPLFHPDGMSVYYAEFPNCVFRRNGPEDSLKKVMLYFNGTYAPYHSGHLEAVVKAAQKLQEDGYDVVGVAISPSKQSRVQVKLGRETAMLYDDVSRIAMIDLALSSCCAAQEGSGDAEVPNQVHSSGVQAFVDTCECLYFEPDDLYRYDSIAIRFAEAVSSTNKKENTNFSPVVGFIAGDDAKKFLVERVLPRWWNCSRSVSAEGMIMLRSGTSQENVVEELLRDYGDVIPPQIKYANQELRISSSAIRDALVKGDDRLVESLVGVASVSFCLLWKHGFDNAEELTVNQSSSWS